MSLDAAPGVTGIAHVNLTVTDLAQARRFWTEVMGLTPVRTSATAVICVDAGARLAVGCRMHDSDTGADFDERNVGLDHLAFWVADLDRLERWQARFTDHRVDFTPIEESQWAWHLNVRAPDNIALELTVMKRGTDAWLFPAVP